MLIFHHVGLDAYRGWLFVRWLQVGQMGDPLLPSQTESELMQVMGNLSSPEGPQYLLLRAGIAPHTPCGVVEWMVNRSTAGIVSMWYPKGLPLSAPAYADDPATSAVKRNLYLNKVFIIFISPE
ncbi:hypothetical protein [Paracidovorax konjaci]|uniref:hypothetical protein n=1 Tax=Paracidovorax konjaci TaxID=32040 RepID=UPI001113CEF2|nr:hypothetical protein [Paracidovorax konjaci]